MKRLNSEAVYRPKPSARLLLTERAALRSWWQ